MPGVTCKVSQSAIVLNAHCISSKSVRTPIAPKWIVRAGVHSSGLEQRPHSVRQLMELLAGFPMPSRVFWLYWHLCQLQGRFRPHLAR